MKVIKKPPFILGILILLASCTTTQPLVDVPVFIRNGAVKIILEGFAQRETMAVLADVDHVRFELEVSQAGTQSQTLTSTQLANGGASASVVFSDLYPNAATLSVTAFDNASNALGTTVATTNIQSGVVTTVPITLQLD